MWRSESLDSGSRGSGLCAIPYKFKRPLSTKTAQIHSDGSPKIVHPGWRAGGRRGVMDYALEIVHSLFTLRCKAILPLPVSVL